MPSAALAFDVHAVTRLFKALGDDTRLRIVALLSHGELCVCHLESALELPQPTASRQLGILKTAGIVESRREGSWIYHRLAPQLDERCREQLKTLVRSFSQQDVLKKDVARLVKSRGPGSCQ
jgi:ArsR family transcriptional regulator, arsenate/arsenite/antimonite-responsive transcriptional repressor